jgi:hypothetical protein
MTVRVTAVSYRGFSAVTEGHPEGPVEGSAR